MNSSSRQSCSLGEKLIGSAISSAGQLIKHLLDMSGFKVVNLSVVISIFMREKTMNSKILAGIAILTLFLLIGCSGTKGKLKTQSESESKVTQQKLIKNWSDYDIWLYHSQGYPPPEVLIIIFDTKIDNREIVVEQNAGLVKVKDQQMWTKVVKENTTGDGDFRMEPAPYGWGSVIRVLEISDFDNQLFGYVVYHECCPVNARLVEENKLRLYVRVNNAGGAP